MRGLVRYVHNYLVSAISENDLFLFLKICIVIFIQSYFAEFMKAGYARGNAADCKNGGIWEGFFTAANAGMIPGKTVHLPHIDCLMVKELVPGALKNIRGVVEYDFYEALR